MAKRIFVWAGFALFFSVFQYAQPNLKFWLENDLELKKLALELEKAQLSNRETKISNGISVQLASGSVSFQPNDKGSKVSFSPSGTISVPFAANLSLKGASKVQISEETNTVTDTAISISADIFSSSGLKRKITALQSQRTLLEAQRAFKERAVESETEFYKELKELFSSASEIVSAKNDLYDDTIEFEKIKSKGFEKTSASYRQAQMKVLSDSHTVETKVRQLEHKIAVFASKCGSDYKKGSNPFDFLPNSIPEVDSVDVLSFKKENYKKIEQANWNIQMAELQVKAEKSFSLSANAGYTFENSNAAPANGKNPDTIDAGLSSSYKGINVAGGISVPVDSQNKNPVYTLSASVNPATFFTNNISKKKTQITLKEEKLALESALDDYETDLVDCQTELADINWQKETNIHTFGLYSSLENDLAKYLKEGIITESEYNSSAANKELYRIKILINAIDLIIFNNQTKLLFCE